MEPTATVRRRRLTFSELMILNRWDRTRLPNHRIMLVLLLASIGLCVLLLLFERFPQWRDRLWANYLSLLGPSYASTLSTVASVGVVVALSFMLLTLILSVMWLVRGLRAMREQAANPANFTTIEIHVRSARFAAGRRDTDARPWALIAIARGRVLYHSAWSGGEPHPPSPVDSFPPGKFPSEFRLVLHAWHRSILRIEPLGPLVDAAGTLTTREVPALPDGGITRSPRDRWALFEGDLEHPASLRRIECDSVAAIEAALAPTP